MNFNKAIDHATVISAAIALSACAIPSTPSIRNINEQKYNEAGTLDLRCGTFEVLVGRESAGTGFFYKFNNKLFALTAGHTVISIGRQDVKVRLSCSGDLINSTGLTRIPGIDAAILHLESGGYNPISFDGYDGSPPLGTKLMALGYPNFSAVEPRFRSKLIAASGELIEYGPAEVLFSLTISYKGSSGEPVFTQTGHLVGLLTNRVVIDGTYSGVSFGVSEAALRSAISKLR